MVHDKQHFYKYLSVCTTKAVLKNMSVRWSSPIIFNDPFDLPANFDFNFSGDTLAEKLLDECVGLTFSSEEPKGNMQHPLFSTIMMTRKNRDRLTPEQVRGNLKKSTFEIAQNFRFGIADLRKIWESFRTNARVFCVSEDNDDIVMWSHYAENHEGTVMKLKCLPELDRPLCAAISIEYEDEYPLISSLKSYVKHLTGQKEINTNDLFLVFVRTKSKHWGYEKEWRCVGYRKENCKDLFDYESIIPEELEAIYLGCRMNSKVEKEIMQLLDNNFPDTEVYKSKASEQSFSIYFEKLR